MDNTITLAAVGDVCICKYIRENVREHGPGWPFELVRAALRADIVFGNLECVAYKPGTA